MKKSLFENGRVAFVSHNPEAIFPAEIAAQFVPCDDEVQVGWGVVDGVPVAPADKTPAEKLAAELAGLADGYQADTLEFQRMLGTIMLADGPTEAAKISAIRTQWNARKAKYISDAAAVRAKYA